MVVKCGATEPNLPQAVRLGKYFAAGKQEFPVDTGRSYRVIRGDPSLRSG